jgi:hypothetical protein
VHEIAGVKMRPSVPDSPVDDKQIGRTPADLDSGTLPTHFAAFRQTRPRPLGLHDQHRVRLGDDHRRTQLGLVTPEFVARMQIEGDQFVARMEKHPTGRGASERLTIGRPHAATAAAVRGAEREHRGSGRSVRTSNTPSSTINSDAPSVSA